MNDDTGGLRQLTPKDVVFVGGETGTIHQHTGGLVIVDTTGRPDFGYDVFRAHIEDRLERVPHFRWRLHEVPLGLDLPYWVEDEDFSYDHHIRRIAVPSPGDREALGALVGYLYSRHLDRRRPLWEAWYIEGLGEGRAAFFTKLHHAMMDGQGATKLGEVVCDLAPDGEALPLDPEIAGARPGKPPRPWRVSLTAAGRLAALPVRAGLELLDGARQAVAGRLNPPERTAVDEPIPVAEFNRDVSRERGFLYGTLPLGEIKATGRHFGATVNDVVLALVSTSLRNYLLDRGTLPDTALRTSIAVSLRRDGDDDFSNHVTTANVTLATSLDDPLDRLRAISVESAAAKEEARRGGKGFLERMAVLPPALVNVALSMAPPAMVPRIAGINLLVSNVRGSPLPLYFAGARITGMYPMSIIMPGGGLNVTCISLVDEMQVGITIEPTIFTEPWRLIDGLREALDEYLRLAGDLPTA